MGELDSAGSGRVQWRDFVNTVMNLRVPWSFIFRK
jgi:hypothetical protein